MSANPHYNTLQATAAHLTQRGKGILAADESIGTIGKRLASISLENTPEMRRSLRQMLLCASGNEKSYAGVILFHETLYQNHSSGKPFVTILNEKGILPGVKVDMGLQPVPHSLGETTTAGLDGLAERCAEYYQQGARFAKWRAALRIDPEKHLPTNAIIHENAVQLAKYAAIVQSQGLLPIVEPEVLIDGSHSMDVSARTSERVIAAVYKALNQHDVIMKFTLLKPMMIMPGAFSQDRRIFTPEMVALKTLGVMKRVVPWEVPGIMFLSGGMGEEEATSNLNALNVLAEKEGAPWVLSFSFGRALQNSAMRIWNGEEPNLERAMQMAADVARVNGMAVLGKFDGQHPASGGGELYEGFRGWIGRNPTATGV